MSHYAELQAARKRIAELEAKYEPPTGETPAKRQADLAAYRARKRGGAAPAKRVRVKKSKDIAPPVE